jgi:hypothetical protein
MTTTTTDHTPRAWVGCLACYNGGSLVGEWLDADGLEDSDTLAAICTHPGHEELWVFDTDGLPGGEMSPDEAARKARALTDYLAAADDYGLPAAVALEYLDSLNLNDPDDWPRIGDDVTYTSADSKTDYVCEFLENAYSLPKLPFWLHIDYAGTFEDMTSGETKIQHMGTLYVFHDET